MRTNILLGLGIGIGGLLTTACGAASVHPLVTEDAIHDDRLAGTWVEPDGDTAVITAAGDRQWRLVYVEKGGKRGAFDAVLGTLGRHRILDVYPGDPAPDASDLYRSLLLRSHWFVVIDSIDATTLRYRMIESDSLRKFLERNAGATPHTRLDDGVLLTGDSKEVRRFLAEFMQRRGALTEQAVWKRDRVPEPTPSSARPR